MKIKLFYETLNGEKKCSYSEMKNAMGKNTYFDYYQTFKRCDDKIKEDFIIVVYNDNNEIIHKEVVHIHWVTNPSDAKWQYGITICGNRVVSEVRYGKKPYLSVIITESSGILSMFRHMMKMEILYMIKKGIQ